MATAPTEDSLSVLAVLLDCGAHWCRRNHEDRAANVEQLLLFLNAYHLHSASSLLTVFATHEATVRRLWPPGDGEDAAPGTPQQLRAAVAGGVTRMDSTTGQYSVMPAWSENDDVMSHLQQIWAFLRARSDGELPAGRPEPLKGNG